MFQSISILYIRNHIEYNLVDSDFGAIINVGAPSCDYDYPVIAEIANVYVLRNLNVAANLALYYLHIINKRRNLNLDWIISYNKRE